MHHTTNFALVRAARRGLLWWVCRTQFGGGKHWTQANIGNALAGREIARHLSELGTNTRGPAPLTKRDRSRFLSALDTALQAALREAARG